MAIRGGYLILDHTPTADTTRKFQQAAAKIYSRGLDICGVTQSNSRVKVTVESFSDASKKHAVILMADDISDLDVFFGSETDQHKCFKQALALVQRQSVAAQMIEPITPEEFRQKLPAFAVIDIR